MKKEKLNNPRYCILRYRRGLGLETEEEGYVCAAQRAS